MRKDSLVSLLAADASSRDRVCLYAIELDLMATIFANCVIAGDEPVQRSIDRLQFREVAPRLHDAQVHEQPAVLVCVLAAGSRDFLMTIID
ncbi:MAG: hypothetical protein ACXWNH_20350 [Vulcanimicrobiaceae bacterium]